LKKVLKTSQKLGFRRTIHVTWWGPPKVDLFADIRKHVARSLSPGTRRGAQGGSLAEVVKYGNEQHLWPFGQFFPTILYAGKGMDYAEKAREEALNVQQEYARLSAGVKPSNG
jgi:orotidine-5'-phosphate decarboxylase